MAATLGVLYKTGPINFKAATTFIIAVSVGCTSRDLHMHKVAFQSTGLATAVYDFLWAKTPKFNRAVSILFEPANWHLVHYVTHFVLLIIGSRWPQIEEDGMEDMLGPYSEEMGLFSVTDVILYALTWWMNKGVQWLQAQLSKQYSKVDAIPGRVAVDTSVCQMSQ